MVRAITGVKNQTINKNILDAGKRVVNQKNIALPSKVLANLEQSLEIEKSKIVEPGYRNFFHMGCSDFDCDVLVYGQARNGVYHS